MKRTETEVKRIINEGEKLANKLKPEVEKLLDQYLELVIANRHPDAVISILMQADRNPQCQDRRSFLNGVLKISLEKSKALPAEQKGQERVTKFFEFLGENVVVETRTPITEVGSVITVCIADKMEAKQALREQIGQLRAHGGAMAGK